MNNNFINSLLNKQEVKTIINIFEKEGLEIRLVGGCVRNGVLKRDTKDIDCAVNKQPETTIKILQQYNIKYIDFAKKYGSITAFLNNQKFEITSLRKDINQKGRHSDIVYTNDWKIDAERRDFTVNAIYLTSDGGFVDYFGGLKDLEENKIKFIGDIEKRITEDFLRIFRYYRFLGVFKNPTLIKGYDEILSRYCEESFNYLSNDLIRQEILKMFDASFPLNSFFYNNDNTKKKLWIELTKKHFTNTGYELGLKKCLNKIDLLIN